MKTPGSKRKLKKRNIKKCVELLLKGIIRYTLFDIANGKAEYRSDAFNFLMSDTCKRYCSIIGFSYDNYIKKLFGGPEGIPNTTIGIARFLKIHEGTLYQHIKKGIIKYPEGGRGKGGKSLGHGLETVQGYTSSNLSIIREGISYAT